MWQIDKAALAHKVLLPKNGLEKGLESTEQNTERSWKGLGK